MDPVTVSAIVFVLILSVVNTIGGKTKNAGIAFGLIVINIVNYVQFGLISGLWPFWAMGMFYVGILVAIGIVVSVGAYMDAKDSK